jgi:XTP/dITP diphosphohydrolase
MILYCATSNPGKLREFQSATQDHAIRAISLHAPEETGATFEEAAADKAVYYGAHVDGYLFADDSGLEVDALHGAPGVHSARFAGPGATDALNNALLLEKLKGVENRAARFVCVIALVNHGHLVRTFRGSVEGRILDAPRGSEGFGYDPLFYYEAFGCTFGEATHEQKMQVSHRGQALRAMFTFLDSDKIRSSSSHP